MTSKRHTGGEDNVTSMAETGLMSRQAKGHLGTSEAERGKERISPKASGGSTARLTPLSQTLRFQNYERITLPCFKTLAV
jgi:hypothetical protein